MSPACGTLWAAAQPLPAAPGLPQVFFIPDAVPSLPGVILLHHFVTACLLCVPLRYPHLHK